MRGNELKHVAIIGGGPAGLMAAEVLSEAGVQVDVYDAMPSVGRKFLLAGVGGMNITHSEPLEVFVGRYGARREEIARWLSAFGPEQLRAWMHGLGIESFVGSSGKVFPQGMKAAPLLRAWLHRLREQGVRFHVRHRWLGWSDEGDLRFATDAGEMAVQADAVILALGGGSWSRLGSDGKWIPALERQGVAVVPLKPANCGFDVGWSAHFCQRFAGAPLKTVALCFDGERRQGECVVTATGIEGGLIYACSGRLRDAIEAHGSAVIELDLLPGRSLERVTEELNRPRGADSMANHLRRKLGIEGVKAGLLRELVSKEDFADPVRLAATIKALPVRLIAPRPLDEAISSAGGVHFEGVDERLMLNALPGVFCAGEMLDWEAPTGGYLLTACLASSRVAGQGVLAYLEGAR
ncbi:hypothetical protein SAMN05660284_01012 [Formivibrio citricus]|uniref:TIGR03862 family flavoprotein n=1 Tax=Formivibrio citricus TaxID=83765 RepID=A0A1I4XGY1_9NEIS|nr:TIGR03862 family flavoprotein [Formivibrio citricus]SFN24806.1 hypothetical protein SAMN05660284_01012 [Formivibrio citricus]